MNSAVKHTILENLNTAVLLFDRNLCLRYLNPAAEILLSLNAKLVIDQFAPDILPTLPESFITRLQATLTTRHLFTEHDATWQRPDGHVLHLNYTILPIYTEHGTPTALLLELHPIEPHGRITREEQLLTQHQAARTLLRGLAHEIKNPLGGLRGAAQLLERELPYPDLREYTRIIIDEADRLQNLLNRMLGPTQTARPQMINIHYILEHVRSLINAEFPHGPRLLRDYDPSIPECRADPEQLVQALLNIARNGAHAAGGSGTVLLRTRIIRQFTIGSVRHRLVLQITIEDDGPGITPDMLNRIFLPMVSGRVGGTGLGLSIAQELISQHGGFIECDRHANKTRFFVYLPLCTSYE